MSERPKEVEFAGYNRPIQYISTEAMLGGFGNGGYDFETIDVESVEAGVYHIPKGLTTRVVEIVKEVNCRERLIEGAGWFLKISKNGEIEAREFDVNDGSTENVFYSEGDTIVWGAKTDMRAVTFSDRSFTGDMEVAVLIDDAKLPKEFWNKYHELQSSSLS